MHPIEMNVRDTTICSYDHRQKAIGTLNNTSTHYYIIYTLHTMDNKIVETSDISIATQAEVKSIKTQFVTE